MQLVASRYAEQGAVAPYLTETPSTQSTATPLYNLSQGTIFKTNLSGYGSADLVVIWASCQFRETNQSIFPWELAEYSHHVFSKHSGNATIHRSIHIHCFESMY